MNCLPYYRVELNHRERLSHALPNCNYSRQPGPCFICSRTYRCARAFGILRLLESMSPWQPTDADTHLGNTSHWEGIVASTCLSNVTKPPYSAARVQPSPPLFLIDHTHKCITLSYLSVPVSGVFTSAPALTRV